MPSPSASVDWTGLAAVLVECIERLRRPDLDLTWSSYVSAEAAVHELDGLRRRVVDHDPTVLGRLPVRFAPTGPLPEAAMASGWGDRFVALADGVDQACGGAT